MPSYTQTDLDISLAYLDRPIDSIETRMPPGSLPDLTVEYGLLGMETNSNTICSQGFAREFLEKARRPRFRFIAPGLQMPVSEQPFPSKSSNELRPVLLAKGTASAQHEINAWPTGRIVTESHVEVAAPPAF